MKKRVIYKITNLINGKFYIGKDSSNRKNYWGSGVAIKAAIKKYGIENFKKEVIAETEELDELNYFESSFIIALESYNPDKGYNRNLGGLFENDFKNLTEEQKELSLLKRREIWASPKFRETCRNRMLEYYKSEENRNKQSERLKSYWANITEEKANEISVSRSIAQNKRWKTDEVNKERLSNYMTKNNPMFDENVKEKVRKSKRQSEKIIRRAVIIYDIEYRSIVEACEVLNITRNAMVKRLKSKNFKEYKYK